MGMTKRTGIMLADDLKVTVADMRKVMKQLKITKKMNEYLYPYEIEAIKKHYGVSNDEDDVDWERTANVALHVAKWFFGG